MKSTDQLFRQLPVNEFNEKVFNLINNEWMLITAGTGKHFNTMTASWGTLGALWNKPVAICFIRPTRHTFEFANEHNEFTLSFFTPEHKGILQYCGAHSGRDVNKCTETNMTPLVTPNGGVTFDKARLFMDCTQIYADDLKPELFLLPGIDEKIYPAKDYHRFYIGEIVGIGTK